MRSTIGIIIIIVGLGACLLSYAGCSGSQEPVAPSIQDQLNPVITSVTGDNVNEAINNRNLWGLWLIGIDPENNTAEIIPLRSPQTHWNILNWLENWPCTDCLQITSFTNSDHGTKLVDIKIQHPFSDAVFTGFDVRGIAMFNGSHVFPVSGLNLPDRIMGDGELLNPDGLTTLYNFTTNGQGPGGLQGYLKGKFATATPPLARINGFMRYVSSGAGNTRDAFFAGDSVTRTFDIDMPPTPFVMGYAVDASWAPPTVKPVEDPMADFPPEANCFEPYGITVTEEGGGLTEFGGEITLKFSIFDHQGNDSHAKPVLECPQLFDTPPTVYGSTSNPTVYIHNEKGAPPGDYVILVSVEDNENASSSSWIDLTAYTTCTVTVTGEEGWARTWGNDSWDIVNSVTFDNQSNVFVGGCFSGTVDFDPGPDEDFHSAYSASIDAFVSQFDLNGEHIRTYTWGGPGRDVVEEVHFRLYYDSIYIVGSFENTVDFDPGSGINEKTSLGGSDAYYSRFYTDGTYSTTETWGGSGDDTAVAIDFDSGFGELFAGSYENTVDFPHTGSETSNGGQDVYLLFGDGVDYEIVVFGDQYDDATTDARFTLGGIVHTGTFRGSVDFGDYEPDIRTSKGSTDVFMASYTDSGGSNWIRTWGGTGPDSSSSLIEVQGVVYVTGSFQETVNFNGIPSGPADNKTSSGFSDAFISSYVSNYTGEYLGTTTFGAGSWDNGNAMALGSNGNIFCAGRFNETVLGNISYGSYDAILVEYDSDLNPIDSHSWGGTGSDSVSDIYIDPYDRMFVTGGFNDMVDFGPGDIVDNHTSNGGVSDSYLMKLFPGFVWE